MRKRSKFNIGNFHNCTFKMGYCYPTSLFEVLPGDSIQMSQSAFFRLAPMVAPVMHPVHMFTHFFFCPTRVLADAIGFDFESFITGGKDGTDTQTIPKVNLTVNSISHANLLADAFGIPVQMLKDQNQFLVNAFPFLAYYMIWNEYYRDQDLTPEIDLSRVPSSSSNPYNILLLQAPSWSKDYFTTARPWPQKGPDVTIPIDLSSGQDPFLTFTGQLRNSSVSGNGSPIFNTEYSGPVNTNASGATAGQLYTLGNENSSTLTWNNPGLRVADPTVIGDVTYNSGSLGTGAISVNDLREALALQRFEEARALYGSRYEDYLRYLGVRPQDSRLQMPEYLGGYTAPVQFSEVLQTSAGEYGGVGDMAGHGISAARSRRIRRFIPEHGYIMAITCVRPIPVYAQGLERLWSKNTKYDFWEQKLEHIGQQEVLNSEVYADGSADDSKTFGFQNRYDEYRRGVNIVTGEFRTNQDFWTMARIFANRPALNSDFVTCNPTDRIFQVGEKNSDQIYAMFKNNVVARRLVSKNGNPI